MKATTWDRVTISSADPPASSRARNLVTATRNLFRRSSSPSPERETDDSRLATNVLRYGALSQDGARLRVAWEVVREGPGGGGVVLDGRQTGVAMPAEPPARNGYGSEPIERALPDRLGAETRRDFTPGGVHRLSRLLAGAFTLAGGAR